jgi:methylenetetrahydrofolate reductase (NADPH)
MRIIDRLTKKPTAFSFEFFPPKSDEDAARLLDTARSLKELAPDFISVTWGAGGGTRRKTLELVSTIKNEIGVETLAHLTCVGAGRAEIDAILDEIASRRIENVLALRGDPPQGVPGTSAPAFTPHPDGFRHADELVAHVRRRGFGFCLGVAGYPEGHLESKTLASDLDNLKRKVDQGADFIITQLFFNNDDFLRFRDRVAAAGLHQPIVAGIMPVTNVGQLKRFTQLCGAQIPASLHARLDPIQNDAEAVVRLGIEHATEQCRGLLRAGVAGIHFYTLNRSRSTAEILRALPR